ncbi:MAG: NAD(P)-binding protein, partial [Gammaproteobacteria bacterium]
MAEHNHKKLNVAIIGGGVSALSVAYHLKKMGHGFTIFEKAHHIGGNARTIPLRVAGRNRWVDLGVNDFNYKTYRHLVQVFNELGVEYRRLEDTTSYADIGEPPEPGRILETGYTMDGQWKTEMPPVIRQGLEAFQRASVAYFKDPAAYQDDTVEVFAAKFNLSPEFLQMNLYARISGMYFAGDSDPSQMPIRMVMHYYNIQEGLGQDANPDPIRMYWVGGTRQWIVKLAEHLQKGETNNIRTRTQATFESLPDGRAVVYSMKLEPDCKTPIEGAKPQ